MLSLTIDKESTLRLFGENDANDCTATRYGNKCPTGLLCRPLGRLEFAGMERSVLARRFAMNAFAAGMDVAAGVLASRTVPFDSASLESRGSRLVNADEFRDLLVSHRRMVRFDRSDDRLRGLRDLDTGEVFLVEERRLFDARR